MAKVASKVLDFETQAVEFAFEGDADPIVVKLADFSSDVQLHFALHGISQKLGDAYSSAKGVVADAKGMFENALKQLTAGDWRAARGEGDAKPRTTELAEAVARIKGQELSVVQTALAAATDEQKKTLRSNERVKATIAVIRAEKAQAKLAKLDKAGADEDLGI